MSHRVRTKNVNSKWDWQQVIGNRRRAEIFKLVAPMLQRRPRLIMMVATNSTQLEDSETLAYNQSVLVPL